MPVSFKKRRFLLQLRWFLTIGVVLFGIATIFHFYGKEIGKDLISRYVKRESDNRYALTYRALEFNLLEGRFTLFDADFKPLDSASAPKRARYRVSVNRLEVVLKDILSLYTEKRLHLEGVEVYEPRVVIEKTAKNTQEFTRDVGNLYLLISDYVKVLQIDYFDLRNGTFQHDPSGLVLDNLSFELNSFLVDSTGNNKSFFYSEAINLTLERQTLIFPDSLHQIYFDRLHLSTSDSILRFENVEVDPLTDSTAPGEPRYQLYAPDLEISGIDYLSAYHHNRLTVDSIAIDSLFIDIKTQKSKKPFPHLLAGIFDRVDIGALVIGNSSLKILTANEENIQAKKLAFALNNVQLDSTNLYIDTHKRWFSDIEANLEDMVYVFKDSLFTLFSQSFHLSTYKDQIAAHDVNITLGDSASLLDSIWVADILVSDVDVLNSLERSEITASKLEILSPHISLVRRGGQGVPDQRTFTPEDLHQRLSPLVRKISSDSVVLKDGGFTARGVIISDINFSATQLHFDTTLHEWKHMLRHEKLDVELSVTQYPYKITGRFNYDESAERVRIDEPRLTHLSEGAKRITANHLAVYGVSLDDFLIQDKPTIDSAVLVNPDILWKIIPSVKEKGMWEELPEKIRLKRAKLNISGEHMDLVADSSDLTLHGGHIVSFALQNLIINLDTSRVAAKEVVYNKSISQGSVIGLMVENKKTRMEVPKMIFKDWDQERWWSERLFMIDLLSLKRPDFNISLRQNFEERKEPLRLPFELHINKLQIDHGLLTLNHKAGSDSTVFTTSDFSLDIHNLKSSHALLSDDHLLFGEGFNFTSDVTQLYITGKYLSFDRIMFDRPRQIFQISGLNFLSKDKLVNLAIPQITLKKANLPVLLDEGRLKAGSLLIDGADLYWEQHERSKKNGLAGIPKIDLEDVRIINTNLHIKPSDREEGFGFKNIELSLQNLTLDSLTNRKNLSRAFENLRLKASDFSYPIENGNYILGAEQYAVDQHSRSMMFKNISLKPQLDRLAYSETLTYQKDWFDIRADELTGVAMDFESWLTNGRVHIGSVALKHVHADIFRDKYLPFDTTQLKPLPQAMLKNIDHEIMIDTVRVSGDFTYSERSGKTMDIATISFNKLDGRLINVSSRSGLYDYPMQLLASGSIYNDGDFTADVKFYMNETNEFIFRGQVGAMDLTDMTKLLKPIANIRVRSGAAESVQFSFTGDDNVSEGTMRFKYDNLKISVLDEDEKGQGFSHNLKTFFANTFVIRKSNPRLLSFRDGVIFYQRDKRRAIFNFWSKSIFSGIVSSIGINRSKRNFLKYERKKSEDK